MYDKKGRSLLLENEERNFGSTGTLKRTKYLIRFLL